LDLRSALHTLYSRASISLPCKFYVRSLVSSYIFILFHRTANWCTRGVGGSRASALFICIVCVYDNVYVLYNIVYI
jgi:hypothetical protein